MTKLAVVATASAVAVSGLALSGHAMAWTAAGRAEECPALTVSDGWYADNKAKIEAFIHAHGRCGDNVNGEGMPRAVFDWDNTVVKNDVGDATFYWLLRNNKVKRPVGNDWRRSSRYLTDAAAAALSTACGTAVHAGKPLPTSSDTDCADELLAVYSSGKTKAGAKAFAGYDHRRMEPSYAWLAQLMAGWTSQQIKEFAASARNENLAAPIGHEQQVGSGKVTGWVRYYDQQRDLINTLKKAGFDVWVVSASPQPVVEVWAKDVGVKPSRTVGIRNVSSLFGAITPDLQGCGRVRDGENSMITYIEGKRCWINKVIYGVGGAAAERQLPAAERHEFAAGDSDTDVTFVRDATVLRLVINRNKNELMCRSYDNSDGRWVINPMFIQPKGAKPGPYPCATAGFTHEDGSVGPVLREDGSVVPDQVDTVH
ncbi:haloacid dehalogenase-like hydrolase [Streptomyces sp. NBC_00879]|uniref:haloacid dehalogenase-like hydrolase n=1 Tax=Streptomyces sp. NBC_00879 TaxID=2975855 RepID=UPI00386C1751|nr:haloacid dehalogenase-like hydrolase [Streptomyces sp. NBC_00879]